MRGVRGGGRGGGRGREREKEGGREGGREGEIPKARIKALTYLKEPTTHTHPCCLEGQQHSLPVDEEDLQSVVLEHVPPTMDLDDLRVVP